MATAAITNFDVVLPPTDLPSEDGVPLESDWHRIAMNLLIDLVVVHMGRREDYFVGGNMFIYFDVKRARDRNFRGPDFFFVRDVPLNPPRPYWAVWDEEGRYPDVIIELTSPSTTKDDHGIKKRIYERTFRTCEYFIYDPVEEKLEGWRLNEAARYQPIEPNEHGWLWSEQLELWVGKWEGRHLMHECVWPRLFEKDGRMIPTHAEMAEAAVQRAAAEKERADTENKRAESHKQHAEQEKQRAEQEKQRADAAEAELRRLRERRG